MVSHFFHELSVLKKLPRSGSFIAGVGLPDTIGAHVFRAAQIAFYIAEMEGANGEHASFLVSVHDNAEVRIGDMHKIASSYITGKKESEYSAFIDQISGLPDKIAKKYKEAFEEFEEGITLEAISAKDADLLECAFQAKEFLDMGFVGKQNWIDNVESSVQTDTAKNLITHIKKGHSNDWWKELKKV